MSNNAKYQIERGSEVRANKVPLDSIAGNLYLSRTLLSEMQGQNLISIDRTE